jgi:hypothetical protein
MRLTTQLTVALLFVVMQFSNAFAEQQVSATTNVSVCISESVIQYFKQRMAASKATATATTPSTPAALSIAPDSTSTRPS